MGRDVSLASLPNSTPLCTAHKIISEKLSDSYHPETYLITLCNTFFCSALHKAVYRTLDRMLVGELVLGGPVDWLSVDG